MSWVVAGLVGVGLVVEGLVVEGLVVEFRRPRHLKKNKEKRKRIIKKLLTKMTKIWRFSQWVDMRVSTHFIHHSTSWEKDTLIYNL